MNPITETVVGLSAADEFFDYEPDEDLMPSESTQHTPRLRVQKRSLPYLGRYGTSKVLSFRAGQLEAGARPVIPESRLRSLNCLDSVSIARLELRERVIPVQVIRRFADGTYEVWNIAEFTAGIAL